MNRAASVLVLIASAVMVRPCAAADLRVFDVWPGKAPKDAGIEGEEKRFLYESTILKGTTPLVTNVTKPTLTMYLPPRDRNTGTAMLICPGGGYHNLFWELEGEEVAAWLNSQGMTGIILKYRFPRRPGDVKGEPPLGPLLDAQRAVSLVRSEADKYGIDSNRIGLVGFSAGGHLAIATATNFDQRQYDPIDKVDETSCRPDFAIGCYSGYLKAKDKDEIAPGMRIPANTPPIFLAHSSDDEISDPLHSVVMYAALKRAKSPAELHVFATGDHDFGVRQNDKLPSSWTGLCTRWLSSRGLLRKLSMPAEADPWSIRIEGDNGTPGERVSFRVTAGRDGTMRVEKAERRTWRTVFDGSFPEEDRPRFYRSTAKVFNRYDPAHNEGKTADGWQLRLTISDNAAIRHASFHDHTRLTDAAPEFGDILEIVRKRLPGGESFPP